MQFKVQKFAAALSTFLVSISLSQASAAPKVIKVGAILPLTGQNSTFGSEGQNGLKLALEKIDKTKYKIELIVEDTRSTPQDAASAINKLINSDKVALVIGELTSSPTMAAAAAAQAAKVPLVSPAATNDNVTLNKDYISRLCFIDSFQGEVAAKFAFNDLKAKTAAIMTDAGQDYSRGLAASFEKAFTAIGGKIVANVSYTGKDSDFTTPLTKVRKAEVIFVPGYFTQVGTILRQANELKIKAPFVGGDGWDSPKLFEIAGPKASAGHYISNHFAPDDKDPTIQEFVSVYSKNFGQKPGAMAALSYDAGLLLNHLLPQIKATDLVKMREEFKNAIANVKDFKGVTGNITLDKNRNAKKPAVIVKSTTNGWEYFARVNP